MKIRNGFVSNSSSSSFIIAYKDDKKKCPTCGRCDIGVETLKNMLNNSNGGGVDCEGFHDVIEQVKEWWPVDKEKEIIQKIGKLEKEGYKVSMIRVSYCDEAVRTFIEHSKNIKIIERED